MEAMRAAAHRVLLRCCAQDIERILRSNVLPEEHVALPLSAIALANHEPELAAALYARPLEVLTLLDEATYAAQMEVKAAIERRFQEQQAAAAASRGADGPPDPQAQGLLNVYGNVHVRLVALPAALDPRPSPMRPPLARLGCSQLHQLISLNGTIVRGGPVRVWESIQSYECSRCKQTFPLKSSLEGGGAVDLPDVCPLQLRNQPCPGAKFKKVPGASIYSGFQEIRLQAATACLGLGEPPASVTVVLQDELADSVRPGDSVDVVGVLVPRWLSTAPGRRCELELVLVANNITRTAGPGRAGGPAAGGAIGALPASGDAASGQTGLHVSSELITLFEDFWKSHEDSPMLGRNKILAGVCPGVAGLLPVKLSALLVLVGGVARREEGSSNIRGELHLLMLGDPGTGKSQIMKWACRASPGRAVLTTGRGSSGAGLTVAATRDGNSWALEAGALVLADGGLCCIDEFDGIKPHERAVIHEAMEQQTVHVAKAGLVTNLSTRTAIIGAINPRPGTTISCGRPLTEVTGLEGPLLSRFDLVLLLSDPRHPDWDRVVAGHVLSRGGAAASSVYSSGHPAEDGSCAPATTSRTAATGGPSGFPALPAADDLKAPLPVDPLVAALAPDDPSGVLSQRSQATATSALSFREPSIAEKIATRLKSSSTGVSLSDRQSQVHTHPPQKQTRCVVTSPSPEAVPHSSAASAWTVDVIRAYITWVRSRPPPVMTPEAERVLVAYYGALRRAEERSTARSTIRALESLIRISQAHARLMCSDEVLLRDAVVAVVLADSSQQLLAIPGSDSITNARFPHDPDGELRVQQQVVLMRLQLASLLPMALPGVTNLEE